MTDINAKEDTDTKMDVVKEPSSDSDEVSKTNKEDSPSLPKKEYITAETKEEEKGVVAKPETEKADSKGPADDDVKSEDDDKKDVDADGKDDITVDAKAAIANKDGAVDAKVDDTGACDTNKPKTVKVEEFLVKFKNFSYLHCQWLTEAELLKGDKRIVAKIKRFQQKRITSGNVLGKDQPVISYH